MWVLYLIIALIIIFYSSMLIYQKVKQNKLGIKTEKGKRFTTESSPFKNESQTNVTFVENDIILKVDEIYIIGKKHNILPGKYVVLSTVDTVSDIQIRLNGNVKNIKHNTAIVLADGDEITPLLNNLILR